MTKNNARLTRSARARLPRYYRCLRELIGEDILRVNSDELGRRMRLTPSQIRQDFSAIGAEGQQGYGYNVKDLYGSVGAALGVNRNYRAVIVGNDGGLGQALSRNSCFASRGVILAEAFVSDDEDANIARAAAYCEENGIDIAVICTRRDHTRRAAELLRSSGVRGFWNLTPTDLSADGGRGITVAETNLCDSILSLACELMQTDG